MFMVLRRIKRILFSAFVEPDIKHLCAKCGRNVHIESGSDFYPLSNIYIGNNVSIGFKSDKRSYDVNVNNDILFVEFDAKCNGANCKIDDIDTKKLNVGNNSFKIKVTAEDGTTGEYKINIIREKKKSIIPYIIGGIILALLIALGIVFFIRRNKDKKAKRTNVEPIDIPEDNFDINNLQ